MGVKVIEIDISGLSKEEILKKIQEGVELSFEEEKKEKKSDKNDFIKFLEEIGVPEEIINKIKAEEENKVKSAEKCTNPEVENKKKSRNFKIGDRVSVMDKPIYGIITAIYISIDDDYKYQVGGEFIDGKKLRIIDIEEHANFFNL